MDDRVRETAVNVAVALLMGVGCPSGKAPVSSLEEPKDMVLIPAGEFDMGSEKGDPDEQPVHTVYLDAYYIDLYEVTNGQYRVFCDATGRPYPPDPGWGGDYSNYFITKPDYPVINVSYEDAEAYCEWVGKRLPTEAEWERAARGTDGREYPWGDRFDPGKSNWRGVEDLDQEPDPSVDGYLYTSPVGAYPSGVSPYGLYDMAGNVAEWVADWYDSYSYSVSPSSNPVAASGGTYRVIRGGSWFTVSYGVRAAFRCWAPPTGYFNNGFRCARTP